MDSGPEYVETMSNEISGNFFQQSFSPRTGEYEISLLQNVTFQMNILESMSIHKNEYC